MTSISLFLALPSAPWPTDQSLFSCAEVTISDRGHIDSSEIVVSSGHKRSDRRALSFLRSLDLSRIESVKYVPESSQLNWKKIAPVPGTGFLLIEHYDEDTFGIRCSGRLLDACSAPADHTWQFVQVEAASRLDLSQASGVMKKQTNVITGLIASFALWGVFEALADNRFARLSGTLSFVHAVLISGLIFWWVMLDSENRSRSLSVGWKAALVLLGIVSMPFYLHANRQAGRRWLSIAKGFCFFAISCTLYAVSYALVAAFDA